MTTVDGEIVTTGTVVELPQTCELVNWDRFFFAPQTVDLIFG